MARQISVIASAFVALIISGGLTGASCAQDCPRGDLDKAYCDRDGDLVAFEKAREIWSAPLDGSRPAGGILR